MKSFIILSPVDSCSRVEVELILRSFESFFESVTNKHKKRLCLVMVTGNEAHQALIETYRKGMPDGAVRILRGEDARHWGLIGADVLFLPDLQRCKQLIPNALSKGIPVLAYNKLPQKQYLDNSCGMLVEPRSPEADISQFAAFLSMLYFDPEARKIMQKGALNRYDRIFKTPSESVDVEAVFSQVA